MIDKEKFITKQGKKTVQKRVLLDSCIYIAAFKKPGTEEEFTSLCKELVTQLLEINKTTFIAAPTMAELIVGDEDMNAKLKSLREMRGLSIVSFGLKEALVFKNIEKSRVTARKTKNLSKNERFILKFDEMIMACAKANNFDIVISLDEKMLTLCQENGVTAIHPRDCVHSQREFKLCAVASKRAD